MSALPVPAEVLPHRPPFLFVTEVTAVEPGVSARGHWDLTGDEAFFGGHFAVLLDDRYAGKLPLFGGIERARFRRQVVPGERLELEVVMDRLSSRAGKGHGTASVGGQTACEADLLFVIVEGGT